MTDRAALEALLERLERGEASQTLWWDIGYWAWNDPVKSWRFDRLVKDGAYLDAAVALCERVLPGWGWSVYQRKCAYLVGPSEILPTIRADASSPALALVIATVRAKLAQMEAAE